MSKSPATVLLMRVLSHAELYNTRQAPDQVRRAFPGARLASLGAADCDDTALLGADPRIDDLWLLPSGAFGSVGAFRRFMAAQACDATVMCHGATPGINYPKQILASLLCPGRKFFLDAIGRLVPAVSVLGLSVILRAVFSVVFALLLHCAARLAARLRPPKTTTDVGLPETVRRLLFIRLDHIGDVAMNLPALHALRLRYPNAKIDALVLPAVAPLLAEVPDVDEGIPYAAPGFTRGGRSAGLWETLALVRRLRRERYDLAIDLRGNDLCRLIAFASGAGRRLGPAHSQYEVSGRPNYGFLLTHPVSLPDGPEHAPERCLETLHACGLTLPEAPYKLPVTPERVASMRERLTEWGVGERFAVIHARPSEESRQWLPERFAAVADHLMQVHGLDVLLTGTPRDGDYNREILACSAAPEGLFDASGLFTLPELPALFAEAALMVSVDTGPMHVAALVGTPLVTLFHPTLARLHHPYGQPDGVLTPDVMGEQEHRMWDQLPLAAITTAQVLAAVDRKLQTSARISLRLVSNSSLDSMPASSSPFSTVSRSPMERDADAA